MPDFARRSGAQLRNAELAQIHVAKKQLGLDDDTYRAILWTVGRVKSAKDLDWTGRKALLDHFRAKGWKSAAPRKAKAERPVHPGQPGLVRALWSELHQAGRVRDPSDAALGSWLRRNRLPERPEWLSSTQSRRAIESLKKWLYRKE
jgi:phage gp16-like protein